MKQPLSTALTRMLLRDIKNEANRLAKAAESLRPRSEDTAARSPANIRGHGHLKPARVRLIVFGEAWERRF